MLPVPAQLLVAALLGFARAITRAIEVPGGAPSTAGGGADGPTDGTPPDRSIPCLPARATAETGVSARVFETD